MFISIGVEHPRKKCWTLDGIIDTQPSHHCIVCKHAIHSICGTVPSRRTWEKYAPGSPLENSAAGVICSQCKSRLNASYSFSPQPGPVQCFQVMDSVLPNDVQAFRYHVSADPPVKRTFNNSVHIACARSSTPFMEAALTNRQQLILPGTKYRSFCTDLELKICQRAKNALKSRRYRYRHRNEVNRKARARYHQKRAKGNTGNEQKLGNVYSKPQADLRTETYDCINSNPGFLRVGGNKTAGSDRCEGEYQVFTVTDLYEVKRSFHALIPNSRNKNCGAKLRVESDSAGCRTIHPETISE